LKQWIENMNATMTSLKEDVIEACNEHNEESFAEYKKVNFKRFKDLQFTVFDNDKKCAG